MRLKFLIATIFIFSMISVISALTTISESGVTTDGNYSGDYHLNKTFWSQIQNKPTITINESDIFLGFDIDEYLNETFRRKDGSNSPWTGNSNNGGFNLTNIGLLTSNDALIDGKKVCLNDSTNCQWVNDNYKTLDNSNYFSETIDFEEGIHIPARVNDDDNRFLTFGDTGGSKYGNVDIWYGYDEEPIKYLNFHSVKDAGYYFDTSPANANSYSGSFIVHTGDGATGNSTGDIFLTTGSTNGAGAKSGDITIGSGTASSGALSGSGYFNFNRLNIVGEINASGGNIVTTGDITSEAKICDINGCIGDAVSTAINYTNGYAQKKIWKIENDFLYAGTSVQGAFVFAAISSGTITQMDSNAGKIGIADFRDSTTANGGYRVYTPINSFLIAGNESAFFVFNHSVADQHNSTYTMGFSDNTDYKDPVDACQFIGRNNGTVHNFTGRCRNNNVETVTATGYAIINGWYYGIMKVNADATSVNFTLYNWTNDAILWSDVVASNIPTAVGRETGFQVIATQPTTNAGANMVTLDYIGLKIDRPNLISRQWAWENS